MGRTRHWLVQVLVFATLEMGTLMGVPMRPSDIEKIARLMNDTVVSEVEEYQEDDQEDPP